MANNLSVRNISIPVANAIMDLIEDELEEMDPEDEDYPRLQKALNEYQAAMDRYDANERSIRNSHG